MASTSINRRILVAGLSGAAWALGGCRLSALGARHPSARRIIEDYVAARKLPGVVLAVKRGAGDVTFMSAGTLAFDTPLKAGPHTLYRIYSMTKPIVGLAVMRLIERGLLGLDQPISTILPMFADMTVIVDDDVEDTRPATAPITIRHLLTHTSGFSYHVNGDTPLATLYRKSGIAPGSRIATPGPGEQSPVRALEEFAERLARLPLDFDPGARWQYSVGFDLLGLIIERVSGQGLHEHLRSIFFEPLEMVDTDFIVPEEKLSRFTTVYSIAEGGGDGGADASSPPRMVDTDDRRASPFARDRDLPSGGGGLVSSAADYARFCTMVLNEGVLGGRQIVKPETVRLARSNLLPPGLVFMPDGVTPAGFGAGVEVIFPSGGGPDELPGGSFTWGGAAGTTMWVDPTNSFFFVLMAQFMPADAYSIVDEVRTALYRDAPRRRAGAPG